MDNFLNVVAFSGWRYASVITATAELSKTEPQFSRKTKNIQIDAFPPKTFSPSVMITVRDNFPHAAALSLFTVFLNLLFSLMGPLMHTQDKQTDTYTQQCNNR